MDQNQQKRMLSGLAGFAAGLSPMKSFTFLLALGIAALGALAWFRQPEPRSNMPWYGIIAVSYAGGFLIGRVFRQVVKTAAILAALLLGGLALLHYARVDTTKAKQTVKAGSTWMQDQAGRAKDYLLRLLPSGAAAGAGVVIGA